MTLYHSETITGITEGFFAEGDSKALGLWSTPYSNLTGIPPHCPTALTLFKKFGGNETDHRSGPPQRTRNFLKKHLVHENFSVTYTRCSLKPASFQKVCLCEYLGLFFLGVGTFFFGVFPCLSGVLCSSF